MLEFVFHQGDAAWIECEPLTKAGFTNAFSTRACGNLTYKNDDPKKIRENRHRFLTVVAGKQAPIASAHQTHSANAVWIRTPQDARVIEESAGKYKTELLDDRDALLASERNFFIGVKTADCLPVLIADPKTGVMAAVHSGWRGTSLGIATKVIDEMKKAGCAPADLLAALGPAACGRCYEVGDDVVQAMKAVFDDVAPFFSASKPRPMFNNSLAVYTQLIQSGLAPANIFVSDFCTMHQNELFFSHRKEGASGTDKVGRLLSIIGKM